ncbi:hypothetical protein pb186bvf_006796 [Paramecium bursaria]
MHLVQKLAKGTKSPEDIALIIEYLTSHQSFQAPIESLTDLCKHMGYSYMQQGNRYESQSSAFYLIKGQMLADNGMVFHQDEWFDIVGNIYIVVEAHCITLPWDIYQTFKSQYGSSYQQKRSQILAQVPLLDKINSSKLQDQLVRSFQEYRLGTNICLTKSDEPCQQFYVLTQGKLQISKMYSKFLTQQEKQILPKKFWSQEIFICEMNDQGLIGEEFLFQDKAIYNIKIISKHATFYTLPLQQLRLFPQNIITTLIRMFKEKSLQRDDIFRKKAQEIEKNWKNQDKQILMNNEIKKTISFKVIKQPQTQKKSDQQIQTADVKDFQNNQLPTRKIPLFMQQYLKLKNKDSGRKPNEITLQQFIQKQAQHQNPYQLFEQVHDPLDYINKSSNYKRQQFSLFIQSGLVRIKSPDVPKQSRIQIRPFTSEKSKFEQTEKSQLQDSAQENRSKYISSFYTPKPIIRNIKRFYRSQSAHKLIEGLTLLGKSVISQKQTPRDHMFYLRSSSTSQLKINLTKTKHQSYFGITGLPYSTDKKQEDSL